MSRMNFVVKEEGIERNCSCKFTPQQNGVAKRKNMHIAEVARTMWNEKKTLDYFWAEARRNVDC